MKWIPALILLGTIALAISSNSKLKERLSPSLFGPGQIDPSQFGSGLFGPGQAGQFDPSQFGSGLFGPGQFDPSQFGSGLFGPGQFDPSQFNPNQFGSGGLFGPGSFGQGTCTPSDRNRQCFAYHPELSCITYKNGTSKSDLIDRCSGCRDTNIVSITPGCCSKDCTYPPSINGVCTPDERHRQCFAYNPVPSCICYMNGTCVNGRADRCTDCGNEKIYSINKGYCRSLTLSHGSDICQPENRGAQCFANIPVTSCVCYFNGTCTTQQADKCVFCSGSDVASVSKGCCASSYKYY